MNEETDLVMERVLDAPRHLLWRAWTVPELLKQWWCPRPWTTPECAMDLRPGGKFYTRMAGPNGETFAGTGCFLEIVDGERIVWTSALGEAWRPNVVPDGGFVFTASVAMADTGAGKTLYRAVAMHASLPDAERHAAMGFVDGWGKAAEQLAEVARGLAG